MVNRIELQQTGSIPVAPPRPSRAAPTATSFSDLLKQEVRHTREVTFSAHALQRLQDRGITLTADDQARIEHAVDKAAAKGARETVLLMDRLALVVSVPNRTVITAVPSDNREDTVFTNIDSVVVVASSDESAAEQKTNGLDPFGGSLRVAER